MRTILIFSFSFVLLGHLNAQADSVRITPLEYHDALYNPLKGFRYNSPGNYPYDAIIRQYIKWNEIERNADDGLEQILAFSNQKWKGLAENNAKIIPRVYLDWDANPGNEYWPADMTTGDYSSEQFIQRLTELVDKLGKAWDNDSRVAWIQLGIIGYWGEHHHPKPTLEQQKLLGELFTEAFKNKKVLVRYPAEQFQDYNFGMYWDRFGDTKPGVNQAIDFMELFPDRWKTVPNEGEVGYGADYGDANPGADPDDSLLDPVHRTHLINWIRSLHASGCGWISGYNMNDPQVQAGADELQKVFGYRFILKEVTYPGTIQNKQSFTVSFDVENVGSAPFYYDWPVELRLLDAETHEVKWKQLFRELEIHDWMPGEDWNPNSMKYNIPAPVVHNTASFTINNPLPKGKYILALAILDPAGMVPSVKFATSQYFNGGAHPIAYIGIDSTLENPALDPSLFDDPANDNSLYYEVRSSYQSPYGETSHAIPGKIEAEQYDKGGEGLAYHDDDLKEGDTSFRPEDKVDVLARAGASNGSVVSFTEEGEWLEYTADVIAGVYNITLYYYSGETPGDLVLRLDKDVLDTISGMRSQGWDIRDSIVIENVILASGGEDKIVQLEFINNAGVDIDAIKFLRLPSPLVGVSLSGCPADTLSVGYFFQLKASVEPPYADDPAISWKSSHENIATVDSEGIVTALTAGTTTITVTSREGEFSDACELVFSVPLKPVYGVTIGECPRTILITGDTHQLEALVAPPDASDTGVTWSSSNPAVLSVDASGLIKGLSQGTATITLKTIDGDYTSSCRVGVMSTGIAVTSVSLECPSQSLLVDSAFQLIAIISPGDAGDQTVSWSSSDPSVLSVDANGLLSAVSAGNSTITVLTNDGSYSDDCNVMVELVDGMGGIRVVPKIAEVYPNPASDMIHFSFSAMMSKKKIYIYNLYGQLLKFESTYESSLDIETREFRSEAMLIIKVYSGEETSSFKVVII